MGIQYQQDQGVATITLDRPEKKNAITAEMYEAIVARLKEASEDRAVRVVVITGAGNAFTGGQDLKGFADPRFIQPDSPVLSFMHALAGFEKPVIAAVNGIAVGIGVTMLLHCDLVYAADHATFSTPFTGLGLVPEFASTLLFPMIAGRVRAWRCAAAAREHREPTQSTGRGQPRGRGGPLPGSAPVRRAYLWRNRRCAMVDAGAVPSHRRRPGQARATVRVSTGAARTRAADAKADAIAGPG